ncbi:PWWP domain [Sesbania bispinosa]|nr:PWWP domain [Sesbania bispinosa]
MAENSSRIDLNADAVLLDRENEVLVSNSSVSNVTVGVSHSETLSCGDPTAFGEVLVHDQKFCHVGDEKEANASMELLSGPVVDEFHMNPVCDVMIDGSGKEGFGEETELAGRGNGLEAGVEVVGGGCDGNAGEFSCGLVKDENKKSVIQCSDGGLFACGSAEPDNGLVFEFNDGVQNQLLCENNRIVTENGSLSTKVASSNEAQGVDDNLTECKQEVKIVALADLGTLVEDDSKINAADSLVTKDCLKDSRTAEVATCGISNMEDMDVNAKESLHMKDLYLRNRLELETSHELKQPAFQVDPSFQADAQVDMTQNQATGMNIAEAGLSDNIQHGFNLVVDFNSYRNMQEGGMNRKSVFSELNFCVSDLVWGKVRGHPWWPGQICDPSAASEKAKRHLKVDSYLVAFFGDQTFAWNDVSMIKPFQMYFSQMEKQSNLEDFHHAVNCALDEVSKRVEFGLSCPCMPRAVFSKLETQVISNAGIHKQSSKRNGGDRFVNATSFELMNLVNFVKSLAQSPLTKSDRLDFVIARAQLSAFYRSKGYPQLPEFVVLDGLYKDDMEIPLATEKEHCDNQIDEQELKTHLGYSQTRKRISRNRNQPSKKHKLLSDLMSDKSFCIPNDEHTSERKASDKSLSRSYGRKRKAAYNTSGDYLSNAQNRKLAQLQYVSIDEMWSQLCLTAKDPAGKSGLSEMVYFFAEFRNFVSHNVSAPLEQGMSSEQIHDGETGATSTEAVTSMTTAVEPCNDSYWTDRIIQSIPEEQSLSKYKDEREEFLPETPTEANCPSFKSQPATEISTNLGFMQQDTDRNVGPEPSKSVEHLDENESSKEAICPTALTLKFTSLDSVPSTTDLNRIFGRYGPLIESKTELLERTNRARVVFKKRADAETAFSSAGKYSIFGPSLVSYRLKILPRTPAKGTGKRGRKSKKETSSVDGAAV